ncbi:MAG: hypothetical protein JWP91_948 [Fibrobacteres bacterium]|nr:hypothetical protein [Fibrobacterota bacterium]
MAYHSQYSEARGPLLVFGRPPVYGGTDFGSNADPSKDNGIT